MISSNVTPVRNRMKSDRTQIAETVRTTLAWLERRGSATNRAGMARFGITARKVYGVSGATMAPLVKRLGRDHGLALALWETGWLEARILASFVAEPARTTASQMDRWCRDFDNWAVVDTVCFKLFDRVEPTLALAKVDRWSVRDGPRDEFVKRAGLTLLACLALHAKALPDEPFASRLPLVERGAADGRNFVKKGASWALRAVGGRSAALKAASLAIAARLAGAAPGSPARWVGKEALRELEK